MFEPQLKHYFTMLFYYHHHHHDHGERERERGKMNFFFLTSTLNKNPKVSFFSSPV